MIRCLLVVLSLAAAGVAFASDTSRETLPIAYVNLENDARHGEFRGYANIVLRRAADPFAGARTALGEGAVIGRALGIDFELRREQVQDAAAMVDAIKRLHADGVNLFLLDAPSGIIADVAAATGEADLLLFNVTAPGDKLRGANCRPHLLHTYPSRAMLADALVQFAVARNWSEVLVLHGPASADAKNAASFRRAADRFGLDVTDVRTFTHGRNPRERDRNTIELLTNGDYDAVYVADEKAALGRHVPYRTLHPRPVIGDQGLVADAWHWAAERYGAPQLNQRFERIAERRMNGKDWAAWAAIRLVIDAVRTTRSTAFAKLQRYLRSDELNLDTYKGTPGNIRSWNGQLRQPILLHTENAVIGYAPFDGFLHPTQTLDTLGVDKAESACRNAE